MKNEDITIIAGPCSVDKDNLKEIYEIAAITVKNQKGKSQRAIAGTRVVGLKSRTELNLQGIGMGMDFDVTFKNLKSLIAGTSLSSMEATPSVKLAIQIHQDTKLLIASEINNPLLEMPLYDGKLPAGKFLPWNPAVNQIGWNITVMAEYARKNNWSIGLKNGKWVGQHINAVNNDDVKTEASIEKVWVGLTTYAQGVQSILIHRGFDVPDKGDYRNVLAHNLAKRVKLKTGARLFLDPSHSLGPKMRDQIVAASIQAMRMKTDPENYLYDGILIEAGNSKTDTDQHITIAELSELVTELAQFRNLVQP